MRAFTTIALVSSILGLALAASPTKAQLETYVPSFSTDAPSYNGAEAGKQISVTINVVNSGNVPIANLSVGIYVARWNTATNTATFNSAQPGDPYCLATTDSLGSATCAFAVTDLQDTGNGGYAAGVSLTQPGGTSPSYLFASQQTFSVTGLTTPSTPSTPTTPSTPSTPTTPTTGSTTSTGGITIPNPIRCNDATCLISQIIRVILGVIAVIATIMFVWGGLLMLTSGGNEKRVTQAKETLVWAAIGIVVIIISWSIIKFILTSLLNGGSAK